MLSDGSKRGGDGTTVPAPPRALDWDGLRNVRDLGGLPTPLSTNGSTAWGRLARGPRPEQLTQRGWDAASAWGLRTVIDLRCPEEVGRQPGDPEVSPPEQLALVAAPIEDHSDPGFRAVCLPILDSPAYWRHHVRLLPGMIRTALQAIARSEPGILLHCAAGRDRTGLMTALLLANAGVPSASIVADYAQSVVEMAGTATHGAPTHDRQAEWSPAQVSAWLERVTPEVQAFVADHEEMFALIELGQTTRGALRDLLLTS